MCCFGERERERERRRTIFLVLDSVELDSNFIHSKCVGFGFQMM